MLGEDRTAPPSDADIAQARQFAKELDRLIVEAQSRLSALSADVEAAATRRQVDHCRAEVESLLAMNRRLRARFPSPVD